MPQKGVLARSTGTDWTYVITHLDDIDSQLQLPPPPGPVPPALGWSDPQTAGTMIRGWPSTTVALPL